MGKVSDEEIVALAVAQAITGPCRIGGSWGRSIGCCPGLFPDLPDETQYNRRLRRLTPWITSVKLMLAELVAEGQVRVADGTLIAPLPRLRVEERVRGARRLRLLPLQEPVHLGHATRAVDRSQGRSRRL